MWQMLVNKTTLRKYTSNVYSVYTVCVYALAYVHVVYMYMYGYVCVHLIHIDVYTCYVYVECGMGMCRWESLQKHSMHSELLKE